MSDGGDVGDARSRPRRVAIVGGGVGGLYSALMLTDPELGVPCEVTVYSRGWRLGGKCASGRNAEEHDRIEEHGLHLWFGFYANALHWTERALAQLPDELRRAYHRFEDAFIGLDDVVLYEEWPDHAHSRRVSALRLRFPTDPEPAAQADHDAVPSFGATVRRLADVLAATATGMFEDALPFGLARAFSRIVGAGARLGVRLVPRRLGVVPGARLGRLDRWRLRILLGSMGVLRRVSFVVLRPESGAGSGRRRQLYTGLDLLCAALRGILTDRLLERGFGVIDGVELRQWLAEHGARPSSLGSGSVLWALYDLVFGYHRGETGVPELAAGRGLLALLRLLGGYHQHFGFRMASSMGEVAIAPIYDVLRRRGVHFAFFRDLREVHLDRDGALEAVELHRQAPVDTDRYDPFAWTGEPRDRFWSNQPDWRQAGLDPTHVSADDLEDGLPVTAGEPRQVLRIGDDVDEVILAVPAPVLAEPTLSAQLGAVERWRRMLDHSASVATIAYQLWSDAPRSLPAELNDRYGSAVVSSYDQPFSTYCPMDQLAEVERWAGPRAVRVGYGCGVWPEPPMQRLDTWRPRLAARERIRAGGAASADVTPAAGSAGAGEGSGPSDDALARVTEEAVRSLQRLQRLPSPSRRGLRSLLRRGAEPPPELLEPAGTASLVGPRHSLWVRLNDAPAHRYVATPPTNPWFRIAPDDTGIAGLSAVGDWTANLIDGGCVEATVISALLAVRGIARRAAADEEAIERLLPVVGERSWLYHGGPGGPPPTSGERSWSSPALAGALTSVPGPYASDATTLYTWLVRVDPARAAAVARRCFDEHTDGAVRVEPIGSLAMLTVGDIADVSSLSPAYRRLGRLAEKQVVVWLPCRVHWGPGTNGGGDAPEFAMFVPYIWVDNPMSLTTGREGLGWPKAMATFEPADGLRLPLSLSVYGLSRFGPDSVSGPGLPLLSVQPAARADGGVAGPAADAVGELIDLAELATSLASAAVEAFGADARGAIAALVEGLRRRALPQLFAKSLIAADDDARHDFDEIVTSQATVLGVDEIRRLDPCELVVHDVASHPVRADLGLESQALPVGFRLRFDFRQESGTVRWSSWASPSQRHDAAAAARGRRRRRPR